MDGEIEVHKLKSVLRLYPLVLQLYPIITFVNFFEKYTVP